LADLIRPYLIVSVQDGTEFADAEGASIVTLINLLNVPLPFSVIVAVLGIINTLALSVFGRTREIGLLERSSTDTELGSHASRHRLAIGA
jgi:putative ABC transport system permease protein